MTAPDDATGQQPLSNFARRLLPSFSTFAAVLLAAAVAVTTVQVISRFVLNNPFSWAQEIGRYLFVWSVYAGFVVAMIKGSHIRVDVLARLLPDRVGRLVSIMTRLIAVVTFGYIGYLGYGLAVTNVDRPFYTIPGMNMAWLYAAVPAAMGCAVLFLITEPLFERLQKQRGQD